MKFFLVLPIISYFLFFNIALAINPACIDINVASKEELEKITGVGPVLAQRIIDARPFSSIDGLVRVSGIAEKKLSNIKEQNLACVQSQPKPQLQPLDPKQEPQKQLESSSQEPESPKPKIILSFPENNPVNKEIELTFSVLNLKNADYDLKIAIEKEGKTISNIYNKNEDKWTSSHYYLNNLFSGPSFKETFKLKLREENLNFQDQADIVTRIRESGKSSYLEQREKININKPEHQEGKSPETESPMPTNNLAAIGKQVSGSSEFLQSFFIASGLAIFSGILILALKRKVVKR